MLLCGSRLICVLAYISSYAPPIATVFHVDPVSSESISLSTCKIEHSSTELKFEKISFASCCGSIFITECNSSVDPGPDFGIQRMVYFRSRTVCYDVDTNVWYSIHIPFCEFSSQERIEVELSVLEPGQNPLASP